MHGMAAAAKAKADKLAAEAKAKLDQLAAAAKAKADKLAAEAKAKADKLAAEAKAKAEQLAAAAKAAADKVAADAKATFQSLQDKVPQWAAAAKNGFVKGADGFASWTKEQLGMCLHVYTYYSDLCPCLFKVDVISITVTLNCIAVCICSHVVCVCVCVVADYMLKDPNAPPSFTSPVLPGDVMATGADADLLMAQVSALVYTSNAAAGASLSLSFKGKCSTVVVKAAFMRNNQRSWVLYLPDLAAVAIVFRGTTLGQGVATAIDNVVSDLTIVMADCKFNNVQCGRVSKGFLDLYQAVRTDMMSAVLDTIKVDDFSAFSFFFFLPPFLPPPPPLFLLFLSSFALR
jgi:hypothetical protein